MAQERRKYTRRCNGNRFILDDKVHSLEYYRGTDIQPSRFKFWDMTTGEYTLGSQELRLCKTDRRSN